MSRRVETMETKQMFVGERRESSSAFDSDVHAMAASLSGTTPSEGSGALPSLASGDAGPTTSPVILQRRASQGLQSRLAPEQHLWPVHSEERGELAQRLERLELRLDSIARSVEFSEAFLSLKLKPQLQDAMQAGIAGHAGPQSRSALWGAPRMFLIVLAATVSVLLGAEIHSDRASHLLNWSNSQAQALRDHALDKWQP